MAKFFVSYRRADLVGVIEPLVQVLRTRFGDSNVFGSNVFFDSASLSPGDVFEGDIRSAIQKSNAVLALIGSRWLGSEAGSSGRPRIQDRDDFVRLEIETAFTCKVKVIPILLDDVPIPQRDVLPPTLRPLLERQMHRIRADHFQVDLDALIAQINLEFRLLPWK